MSNSFASLFSTACLSVSPLPVISSSFLSFMKMHISARKLYAVSIDVSPCSPNVSEWYRHAPLPLFLTIYMYFSPDMSLPCLPLCVVSVVGVISLCLLYMLSFAKSGRIGDCAFFFLASGCVDMTISVSSLEVVMSSHNLSLKLIAFIMLGCIPVGN